MKKFRDLNVGTKLIATFIVVFSMVCLATVYITKSVCELNNQLYKQPLFIGILIFALLILFFVSIYYSLKFLLLERLKKLVTAAKKVLEGEMDIELDITSQDEIGCLSNIFIEIVQNCKQHIDAMESISNGDLSVNIKVKSDKDIFSIKYNEMISNMKLLANESKQIADEMQKGNLSVRGAAQNFKGVWNQIIESINSIINTFYEPMQLTLKNLDMISRGNIPTKITGVYYGDFIAAKDIINACIYSINAMIADVNLLTRAGALGKLEVRADPSVHGGEFAKIIDGFNTTLDSIIDPINQLSFALKELAKGNLSVRLDNNSWSGIYAEIRDNFNSSAKSLSNYVYELSNVLKEMSTGNLDVDIKTEFKGDLAQIRDSVNQIIKYVNDVIGRINIAAEQVAAGASQVSDSSQVISQGNNEQAGAIEEVILSMGEIANHTKQNASSADKASELALSAKDEAVQCNTKMSDMLKAMEEIYSSSLNISKIINVIDEIAFQTNILSLNAAVEAARAGQHGKGFAVVAEEVRNLASRSAEAANETTVLIDTSINKVMFGKKIADETASILNNIVDVSKNVSAIIDSIAKASNVQAVSIEQVNHSINQVSKVVQTNSSTSEQTAAASQELSGQAEVLKNMVSRFQVKKLENFIEDFLGFNRHISCGELKTNIDSNGNKLQRPYKPGILLDDREFGKY